MKLLLGSTGMIGRNLKELMPPMLCPTHTELDLTDADKVKDYLRANKPEAIIHCASNDDDICLYDNLRMFHNLAESHIPMITFCTGREIEDRAYKNGEYVLSKHITKELALSKYKHISVIQLWGCFGKYERSIRFFAANIARIKQGLPILVKENKLFSYVYVNDLSPIVERVGYCNSLFCIVGYTYSLLDYAMILRNIAERDLWRAIKIDVESENFYHSYAGNCNYGFFITPLIQAVKELWEASQ